MAATPSPTAAAAAEKTPFVSRPKVYADVPPIQITVRQKEGAYVLSGREEHNHEGAKEQVAPDVPVTYSPDGRLLCLVYPDRVILYDARAAAPLSSAKLALERQGVQAVAFSPNASFLVTWEKPSKAADEKEPNLLVWSLPAGQQVLGFRMKQLTGAQWPVLKWTQDEALLGILGAGEVQLYDGKAPSRGVIDRLKLEGLGDFEWAPLAQPPHRIALVVPQKKDAPASVSIFERASPSGSQEAASQPRALSLEEESELPAAKTRAKAESKVPGAPVASKSFFKAETIVLRWSPAGQAILIQTSTEADASNQSYYGESNLHLLFAEREGAQPPFSCVVPFGTNQGPVQDAAWLPSGKEFLVIQGKQPAQATLFRADQCVPVFQFGTFPRNTIRIAPHGRFAMLGGFGNLAGEMEFWDLYKKKKIASCQDKHGAKSFQWAPDSRVFVTATLFPWRRVDYGYKVWSYAGELLYEVQLPSPVYQVAIRPAAADEYPDRAQSPRLGDKRFKAEQEAVAAAVAAKKVAYVPPHLRGKDGQRTSAPIVGAPSAAGAGASAGPTLSERLRAEKAVAAGPRRLNQLEQASLAGASGLPVGAVSEAMKAAQARAEKRRKKREKARLAKEQGAEEDEGEGDSGDESGVPEAKQTPQKESGKQSAASKAPAPAPEPEPEDKDPAKVAKALQKKLRQVDDLKARQAKGDALTPEQLEKIKTEASLRTQLAKLNI